MTQLPRTIATLLLTLVVLAAAPPPDSPVADAAMRGDLDAVRSLINQGEDVNGAQGDGMVDGGLRDAGVEHGGLLKAVLVYMGGLAHDSTLRRRRGSNRLAKCVTRRTNARLSDLVQST